MTIKCLADDYVVVEKENIHYIYNNLYEESQKKLFLAAILGMFLPETADYYIPVCIKIKKTQDNVTIDNKLNVIGTSDFECFIIKHQYEKWRKTYGFAIKIIISIGVLLNVLFGYLFWSTNFKVSIGACFLSVFLLSVGATIKLEANNIKRKRYQIREVEI